MFKKFNNRNDGVLIEKCYIKKKKTIIIVCASMF